MHVSDLLEKVMLSNRVSCMVEIIAMKIIIIVYIHAMNCMHPSGI